MYTKEAKYYIAVALAILGGIISIVLSFVENDDAFIITALYYGLVGISFVLIGFGAYMFINYVLDPYKGPGHSKITEEELKEYRETRKKAREQRKDALEYFFIGLIFIGVWYVLTSTFGSMTV